MCEVICAARGLTSDNSAPNPRFVPAFGDKEIASTRTPTRRGLAAWMILGVLLLSLPSTPGRAALTSMDLLAPGDGLITRDTATSLDWLDLTPTVGLSFNQVAGGVGGWTGLGFQYATTTQVMGLYT